MTSSFSPEVEAAIEAAAKKYGVSADLMRRFAQIESSGNPKAVTGSHLGLYQFTKDLFQDYGGGDIYSAKDNAMAMAAKLAHDSRTFTSKYKRDATDSDLYMIHNQGAAGYGAHMSNPEGVAWQNIRPYYESDAMAKSAIWGNVPDSVKSKVGSVDNLKSGQFMDFWHTRSGGGAQAATPPLAASLEPRAPGDTAASTPPTTAATPPKLVGDYGIPSGPISSPYTTINYKSPSPGYNPAWDIDVFTARPGGAYADGGHVDTREYMAGVDPSLAGAAPPLPERAYPVLPSQPPPPMPERAHLPVTPLPPLLANNEHFSKVWELLHHNPSAVPYQDLVAATRYLEHARRQKGTLTPTDQGIQEPSLYDKFMGYLREGTSSEPQKLALGGKVKQDKPQRRHSAVTGYINSDSGGVADKLAYNANKDSYVLPADVVSGLGDGNSNAGAKVLDAQYKARAAAPRSVTVPVKLSGGEYVVHPAAVKRAGGGSIDKGLDHFDSLVHRVRARTINKLHEKKAPIR